MVVYSKTHKQSPRAGFSLIELFVAGILLAAMFSAIGSTVYWIQRAQRTTEQQQFAMLELSNLMEQVFVQAELPTSESLSRLSLSSSAQDLLPDATLTSEMTGTGIDRKLTLMLTWTDAAGQTVRPTQLVAWLAENNSEEATATASLGVQQEGSL